MALNQRDAKMIAADTKKYLQVASYVESLIKNGRLSANERLPSDRELAKELKVTAVTVNKGLMLLARKNLIYRKVGSGSFVSDTAALDAGVPVGSGRIGMLLHSKCDAYGMYVVKAIHEAAGRHGIKLDTACANGFKQEALYAAGRLAEEGCCALIIPWIPYMEVSDVPGFLRQTPVPATVPVALPGFEDHCTETPEIAGQGDLEGAKSVCEYFHLLGERRIALLGPDNPNDIAMKNKLMGYTGYVSQTGLENLAALTGPSTQGMDSLAARWAEFKGRLAVVCYDDVHAMRFMTSMRKLGLSAPGDFRIIGTNDSKEAMFCDPPLSSLQADYARLGEISVKAAMAMAKGGRWRSATIVPNRLVVRESCGGVRSGCFDQVKAALAERGFQMDVKHQDNAVKEV